MSQELITRPEGAMDDLVAAPHIASAVAMLSNALIGNSISRQLISRLPTVQERGRLQERKMALASLLRPTSDSGVVARERIAKAVGAMLGGWLNVRVGNPAEVIAGFTAKLQELPAWAVIEACRDFEEGRATFLEGGKERTLSPEYAPSVATVWLVASRKLEALKAEQDLIRRIMTAKLAEPAADPAMQARVKTLLEDLAAEMGAKARQERAEAEAESKAALAAVNERRDRFAREANERRLARYAELGLVPVYVGDKLCDADALPHHLQHLVEEQTNDR
jgi:hypothetical protein